MLSADGVIVQIQSFSHQAVSFSWVCPLFLLFIYFHGNKDLFLQSSVKDAFILHMVWNSYFQLFIIFHDSAYCLFGIAVTRPATTGNLEKCKCTFHSHNSSIHFDVYFQVKLCHFVCLLNVALHILGSFQRPLRSQSDIIFM